MQYLSHQGTQSLKSEASRTTRLKDKKSLFSVFQRMSLPGVLKLKVIHRKIKHVLKNARMHAHTRIHLLRLVYTWAKPSIMTAGSPFT